MAHDKLAHRFTIAEVVRIYQEAEASIRGAFAQLAATEQTLNDTFTLDGMGHIHVQSGSGHHVMHFDNVGDVLLRMRHDVWKYVIDRLELRRMMSNKRWTEINRQLEKHELPEITEENVEQIVGGFHRSLKAMLEEAVEEVFDWLRPRHSIHKTNTELEIGEDVILRYVVETWDKRWKHSWRVNYHAEQNLTALENVFSALDGRGQITKTHYSEIHNVIHAEGYDGVGETPYFKFKTYKNGNLHLRFKRLDLLSAFNRLAGGRRLRPAPDAAAE